MEEVNIIPVSFYYVIVSLTNIACIWKFNMIAHNDLVLKLCILILRKWSHHDHRAVSSMWKPSTNQFLADIRDLTKTLVHLKYILQLWNARKFAYLISSQSVLQI